MQLVTKVLVASCNFRRTTAKLSWTASVSAVDVTVGFAVDVKVIVIGIDVEPVAGRAAGRTVVVVVIVKEVSPATTCRSSSSAIYT
jgi:hypothetical protein